MTFRIEGGGPVERSRCPAAIRKVMTVLDALQDGVLLTAQGVAARTGYSMNYSARLASWGPLDDYRQRDPGHNTRVLWGNKPTIAALRKQSKGARVR